MGTQRVSSAMYLQHHQALDPGYSPAVTTELGDLVTGFGLDWELAEVLEEPLDLSVVISQEDYEAEIIECATDACRCEVSPYWAKVLYDIDCDDIRIHYCWSVAEIPQEAVAGLREYHPDYASAALSTGLGNTEFITNASGRAHQFFFYSPCSRRDCEPEVKLARPSPAPRGMREGEALEVHSANSGYNSPYRFNSKVWDEETGNYYYGARYYNPKVSIWLSVDPKAHWYPDKTPYNFSGNNPSNIIDPNGLWEQDADGNWIAQKGDGAESLAQDAGLSKEEAYQIMDEQGYGTYTDDDGVTKSAVDPGDVITVRTTSSSSSGGSQPQGSSGNGTSTEPSGSNSPNVASITAPLSFGLGLSGDFLSLSQSTAKVGKGLGWGGFGVGFATDLYGLRQYNMYGADHPNAVSPGKFGLNTSIGLYGLSGTLGGAAFSPMYFGFEAFYPGGFGQALQDKSIRDAGTSRILSMPFNSMNLGTGSPFKH